MTGAHTQLLAPHGRAHDLPAAAKILATFAWVIAMTFTPRDAFWAFGAHAACVAAVVRCAQLPFGHVARRLVIEVPFIAFAFALPIIGTGERTSVLGVSLSERGLWAMWAILAKATLGLAASVVLASTTPVSELLHGLERLRVPAVVVGICGFMVRYADVLLGELGRMRIARLSRGHDPRWLWQSRAIASTAGTLFVRSFERGERVHIAMLSRGYDGHLPDLGGPGRTRSPLAAAAPVVVAVAIVLVARVTA